MNNNLTEIIFILDRSGSMEHLTDETIGGFNSLINKHKTDCTAGDEVYVTTVLFDDQYELLHDHVKLADVPRLTRSDYYARGCTALLDAVGRTIKTMDARIEKATEDNKPGKVLFVITTDGYENASREFSKSVVKSLITAKQELSNWNFLFLGANIDAVGEADSLGIRSNMAVSPSASARGVRSSFKAVDNIVRNLRVNDVMDCASFAEACCDCLDDVE